MATAAERRETRRRKLLQNSENRMNRILGSRSSYSNTSHSQIGEDESGLKPSHAKEYGVFTEKAVADVDNGLHGNNSEGGDGVLPLKDQCTRREISKGVIESKVSEAERFTGMEVSHCQPTSMDLPRDTKKRLSQNTVMHSEQRDEENSSTTTSNRLRILFIVILAFVLVSYWTYVNLEVLLSLNCKERTDSYRKLLVQSQSFIWPFLAAQVFFVCFTRFQQISHSAFISLLTVALQLCGIPMHVTHKINFVVTALLACLKDFVVLLFSSVVFHHVVEYGISSGLLKQVLENFK